MSMTPLGWFLIAALVAISASLVLPSRSRGALISGIRKNLQGNARTLIVAAAAFLLVAGIGAASFYLRSPFEATSQHTSSLPHSGSDGDMLARLKDYAGSGAEEPAPARATGKLLPDVNTMIERLVARLETTPQDIKGWGMLGWSYFHTGRYEQAAAAYARAVELDPNSAELKTSYEEAKAKASAPSVEQNTKAETMPARERDAAIRAMVDGLADRLASSPRDVEGWTRLMRSRVVLGEKEVAATALRKALEVFKEDPAARGKITAAAIALGLKAE
jgi:cytochrome c-type biogenesis protein CcmH/NrfG